MDIYHKIDVNVPAEFIFDQITDVASISTNLPSNVVLRAETDHSRFDVGSRWIVRAQRTGRKFALNTEVTRVTENEEIVFNTTSTRIESNTCITVTPTGSESAVVEFRSTLSPKGLLGRILIQSLKASRKRLDARLESTGQKVVDFLEDAYDS